MPCWSLALLCPLSNPDTCSHGAIELGRLVQRTRMYPDWLELYIACHYSAALAWSCFVSFATTANSTPAFSHSFCFSLHSQTHHVLSCRFTLRVRPEGIGIPRF